MPRQISLLDLYSRRDLSDEEEILHQFVDEELEDATFEVLIMAPQSFDGLRCHDGATKPMDAFRDHAERWQKDMVADLCKNLPEDRIILVSGNLVVDGYHHLVAAAQLGRSVNYIDLEQPIFENAPSAPAR